MNFLPEDYKSHEDISNFAGVKTHSNYVTNLYLLIKSNKLSVSLPRDNYRLLENDQKIINKLEIVKYTLYSIKTEYKFAEQDIEFMPLTLSWLWVKGYYSVFHLTSLLISFEQNDSRYLLDRSYNEHSKIISKLNLLLKSGSFFNISFFNSLYSGRELANFRTRNYENVRSISSFDEKLFKLSVKKVYRDELKARTKGKRGENRKKEINKLNSKIYSIFDLFLYYRERFNYAGFQYLDNKDNPNSTLELTKFYKSSYELIISVSKSLLNYLAIKSNSNIQARLTEIRKLL